MTEQIGNGRNFSRTALLLGNDGLRRLQAASVAVIGVGGVGSYAVEALARAGIGRLTLVDADVVQPSNINRQLHALQSTLGLPKVQVMAERLRQINPELDVTAQHLTVTPENIPALLNPGYDLLLDAIDSFSAKLALLQACVERSIPVVSSMGAAGKLDPTRIPVADIAASQGCRLARKLRKELRRGGIERGITVVFSDEPFAACGMGDAPEQGDSRRPLGSISYLPAMFGLQMAAVAIRSIALGQLEKNHATG